MAFTASALSLMLENLGKPVVFTGAQVKLWKYIRGSKKVAIWENLFKSEPLKSSGQTWLLLRSLNRLFCIKVDQTSYQKTSWEICSWMTQLIDMYCSSILFDLLCLTYNWKKHWNWREEQYGSTGLSFRLTVYCNILLKQYIL